MDLLKFMLIATLALLASCYSSLHAQQAARISGKWDVVIRHFDFGEMRTALDFKEKGSNGFRALSHRGGVHNLVGGFKAGSASLFSKKAMLRTGALCQLENGTATLDGDKIMITAIMNLPMSSNIQVEGHVQNGTLFATLTNANGRNVGVLEGSPNSSGAPQDDYPALVKSLLDTYQQRIYDRRALESAAFKKFARKMKANAKGAKDDLDLIAAFFTHKKTLPFTHTGLFRAEGAGVGKEQLKARFNPLSGQVSLEEKSPNTAVLRVKSFRCPAKDMDSVMQIVLAKNYQNLIVDIRGNSGGSLEGGITLSKYLVHEATPTGVYLTQKWFNRHPLPPTNKELEAMPAFTKADVLLFLETLDETGIVVLKAAPGPQRFEGKLFLLTDKRSASACEPLAWNLKQTGRATVVGEHTAGAMLSASTYSLGNGFNAVIPNADYYTPSGERLDRVGVAPNIAVSSADALDYVLKNLIEEN